MFQKIITYKKHPTLSGEFHLVTKGFTLIELMIILAVIAIILTLAIPTYSNYSIRNKMGEAITLSETTKAAVMSFCKQDRLVANPSKRMADFEFQATRYVKKIVVSGSCNAPTITMTTQATGAKPSPVLTFNGDFAENADHITWTCLSSGLNIHLPESCRSW